MFCQKLRKLNLQILPLVQSTLWLHLALSQNVDPEGPNRQTNSCALLQFGARDPSSHVTVTDEKSGLSSPIWFLRTEPRRGEGITQLVTQVPKGEGKCFVHCSVNEELMNQLKQL